MRFLSVILLIFLSMAGCTYTQKGEMSPEQRFTRLGYAGQQAVPGDIRLVSVTPRVSRGGNGRLTIQGVPGINYNATATYKIGDTMATASQSKTAGPDGRVTWEWEIRRDTVPGRYPISVSGGGRTFITYYTVIK